MKIFNDWNSFLLTNITLGTSHVVKDHPNMKMWVKDHPNVQNQDIESCIGSPDLSIFHHYLHLWKHYHNLIWGKTTDNDLVDWCFILSQ